MSALSVGLLDGGDDDPPRSGPSQEAGQRSNASDISSERSEANDSHQPAPWPANDGLVSVTPSALHTMQFGTDGPTVCTTRMWVGTFTFGMLGGVWAGLTLLPAVGMPLAGGWFACGSIMAIPLFRLALQAVRLHTADGGFITQLLETSVSPQCRTTVDRLVNGIRVLQALFVVSQTFLYCAGVVMVIDSPGIRPDMVISMLVGMIALFVGSFQVAAMIVAVITSCEVLHDCCQQLSGCAAEATTAEQLHSVYLLMRELDQKLQRAVIALRPVVLSVIGFNFTIAGSLVMQGIESLNTVPGTPEQVPAKYLFLSACAWVLLTLFVILRSPFRLTEHIDMLNEVVNRQRRLRSSLNSDDGSDISLGDQLEELDPEAATHEGVQRVRRVQWVGGID